MRGLVVKEDSTKTSTHQESNKQKTEEIDAIRVNIIKYHLSKFCKANANALALIFKALMRGEAIYSKVQFLQDSQTKSLLCQKVKDSNLSDNPKESAQESKISKMYHKKESKIDKKDSLVQPAKSPKQQEIQRPNNIKSKKDSKDSIQETEPIPNNPITPFPLNIEG